MTRVASVKALDEAAIAAAGSQEEEAEPPPAAVAIVEAVAKELSLTNVASPPNPTEAPPPHAGEHEPALETSE